MNLHCQDVLNIGDVAFPTATQPQEDEEQLEKKNHKINYMHAVKKAFGSSLVEQFTKYILSKSSFTSSRDIMKAGKLGAQQLVYKD